MPRLLISSREHKVFTDRKRKVLRKRISAGEAAFTAVFVVLVVGMGAWFYGKRDDYDPNERDISMALLEEDQVVDTLYRTPLQRWVDPAQRMAGGAFEAIDVSPFPKAILDGGWEASARVQHFKADTLYEKINGAADQYLQFGFQELHYASLKNPEGLELSIELYDMGSMENALGIFAAQRDYETAVLTQGPMQFYPTSVGAIGCAGHYYFKIAGTSENAAITEKSRQIMECISGMGGATEGLSEPYRILTQELKVPTDAVTFEKSDVFQYDFATDFWFGKAGSEDSFRYYIHESASEQDAAALFAKLLENHLFDYDEVSRSDNRAVLKHKVLNTYLSVARDGNTVYGVDGAPEATALDEAIQKLEAALNGNAGDETEAYPAS